MENKHRADFPLLESRIENGKPLIYLDSAATTQKPIPVIEAVNRYYREHNASPHRGAYSLSAEATRLYEDARARAARFIGAKSADELIFTKNATEALNLVALSYGEAHVSSGDEILLSVSEHHANLLPWQALARRKGASLIYLHPDDSGHITTEEVEKKISPRTKILAVGHISNVLGVENPLKDIAELAHSQGAVVVADGAQSVPHIRVDVNALNVDFLAFSGHKMLAPGGIGVLYGKKELLESLEPVILGGGIVEQVTTDSVRFLDAPLKFEPGTPNVEGAVGLHAAMDYLQSIGFDRIAEHERKLTEHMLDRLKAMPEIELYGSDSADVRTGIAAFNVKDVHPHDVASILDADGITIRAGHHCAQPLLNHLGIRSCCRASVYIYNTIEDVDRLADSLSKVRRWLGYGSQ